MLLHGNFLILLTAALRLGAGLLLPMALAGLFTLLRDPMVRALRRLGLPTGAGAALVVFGAVGLLSAGGVLLARPAAEWIEAARVADLIETRAGVRNMDAPITVMHKVGFTRGGKLRPIGVLLGK